MNPDIQHTFHSEKKNISLEIYFNLNLKKSFQNSSSSENLKDAPYPAISLRLRVN